MDASPSGDRRGRDMSAEIFTADEVRRGDALAVAAGTPSFDLMERAGVAVAAAAGSMLGGPGPVLVLCGPGDNGGDGFVAARLLAEAGRPVELVLVGNRDRLSPDARRAADGWGARLSPVNGVNWPEAALVIDALFGVGLARAVEGEARAAINAVNAAGRPILSVDLPSGIECDTGAVAGVAIRATRTVTFQRRRPGHLLLPGRAHCGILEVADIGLGDSLLAEVGAKTFANEPSLWRSVYPVPAAEGHKYHRGHAVVVSGGMSHTGAARLAARAALRAGAGLVTLASPGDAMMVNAAHLTAVMLRRCDGAEGLRGLLADARFNAVALGPALGVGTATCDMVAAALGAGRLVVLDADAITSFEGRAAALTGLLAGAGGQAVLTPHAGEFARLFAGRDEVTRPASKLERARRAAALIGGVMVLKGPDTVIAAPDGRAAINANGSPYLATAGSGDVLTGLIAGLGAQGMPPFEAACAGVWLHGAAGQNLGPGLIAEDLPEAIPGVLRRLLAT